MAKGKPVRKAAAIDKCRTGITGLDEITEGGLPRGRTTLVCGSAGSGKTLLSMEFLIRGITEFNEPGIYMSFEETAEELAVNVSSLGFDVKSLIAQNKLAFDYVYIERSEIEETGEYDLEGLFVRLNFMIEQVGAKRVVIDSIEALFSGLMNEAILRSELRRLFRWMKEKGVTGIVTGEKGEKTLTRYGIEEYVSDCVIFLDHRVTNQVATRRLRVVKYRGSMHGTNEYPTLIDEDGLSVLPISSLGLNYPVTAERVSSGIERLDAMLDGKGFYRGTSVLVSGTAGTGKSSIASAFINGRCGEGEKCMYFSFEESPDQIERNMRSIGIDLQRWEKKGLLRIHSARPTLYGLEMHLARMHKLINDFKPACVIIDPVTNLTSVGDNQEIRAMLTRLIDFLKVKGITSIFTSLTAGGAAMEATDVGISSLMDTWLLIWMQESNGERNRLLYVLKSRGMAHSNQMREFRLSENGINLVDVYTGTGEVLTGTARLIQEARDQAQALSESQASERRVRELQQESARLRTQGEEIAERLKNLEREMEIEKKIEADRMQRSAGERKKLSQVRKAD